MPEMIANKHKLHQRYFSKVFPKLELPGGSTIAGLLDKGEGLIVSATRLTKDGYNYKEVWGEKADIGTVCHQRILFDLKGIKPNLNEYSQLIIDKSESCMKSYYNWKSQHKIKVLHCEQEFISEAMKAGGTFDLVGDIDGSIDLCDYKTGNLHEAAYIQIAGYGLIAEENGIKINKLRLLNFPRYDDNKFEDRILTDKERDVYGKVFKALCHVYWQRKRLSEKI